MGRSPSRKSRARRTSKASLASRRSRRRRRFQTLRCHPGQSRAASATCFSAEDLKTLEAAWNRLHPTTPLTGAGADAGADAGGRPHSKGRGWSQWAEGVWNALKTQLASVCTTESCWAHRLAPDPLLRRKLLDAFAPEAPASWKTNPNEWLSDIDIEDVMAQFEETYRCFRFMGASSIDFDAPLHPDRPQDGAVDPPLATFSLRDQVRDGFHKIAFVFNLDRHDQPGSHWVSLFLNWKKRWVFYFDSAGDEIPPEIHTLVRRLQRQAKAMGTTLAFRQNHPKAHQHGDTECGMYALFFIVHLLEDRMSSRFFETKRLPDEDVQRYRSTYFNAAGTVGE